MISFKTIIKGWFLALLVMLAGVQEARAVSSGPCPTPKLYNAAQAGGSPSGGSNQPYFDLGGLCNILLTFQSSGAIKFDVVNREPFDGVEDMLIGIVNDSGIDLSFITISHPRSPIFGFDNDGICHPGWAPFITPGTPSGCTNGATGYEGGPGVSFSFSGNGLSGQVNFATPIAGNGGTNWFSLEGIPTLQPPPCINNSCATPEPTMLLMLGIGLFSMARFLRRIV